jgi:hypothetical protein
VPRDVDSTSPHRQSFSHRSTNREGAVPAKLKSGAKVGAKAKREAIAKAFGECIVEFDELEQAIWKTLDRIRKRDGTKIFKEVTDRIVDSVAVSIQNNEKRERSSTSR